MKRVRFIKRKNGEKNRIYRGRTDDQTLTRQGNAERNFGNLSRGGTVVNSSPKRREVKIKDLLGERKKNP